MVDNPQFTGPMCDWPELEIIPHALETLRELSTRAICCLATNANDSDEKKIRQALNRVGLEEHLTHVFCSGALGYRKPETAFFLSIVEQLNCPTEQITMVGDSLEKDILGAQACGIKTVWFNPSAKESRLTSPSIQSLHQLLDLL